jgi:hypothetical protein
MKLAGTKKRKRARGKKKTKKRKKKSQHGLFPCGPPP